MEPVKYKILIVDDKEKLCRLMATNYQQQGYETAYALCGAEAIERFKSDKFDIVLLDLQLGADNGIDVLKDILALKPDIPVIIITGFGTISSAVEAMKIGAYDYVQKPVDFPAICKLIKKAIAASEATGNVAASVQTAAEEAEEPELYSKNREFQKTIDNLNKFAASNLPILISGESGVGKEHLADYIQKKSPRKNEKYLKINCSSFSESLLTSELFGHEKGAYTGADKSYQGIFEQADNGTLFLDEIGDMPMSVQVRILRTLQNSEIRRLGAKSILNVNIRIIAASNKNLKELIDQKLFRLDLFYRLNSVTVHIPPLSQRREDLPDISRYLLTKIARRDERPIKILSHEVNELFGNYSFPGNIRELENILNYACTMTDHEVITLKDLPPFLHSSDYEVISSGDLLESTEKDTIAQVLRDCNYNKKKAAKKLGISRSTLYSKLEKYDILKNG